MRPSFPIKLHLSAFSPCSCVLQSFFLNPPFVLLILSFSLCQQYCTVQHVGVFDKKKEKKMGLLGLQRSEKFSIRSHLLSTHIPSPNLIHILFFYIFCVYMYSASVCPVVNISLPAYLLSRYRIITNTGSMIPTHISLETHFSLP